MVFFEIRKRTITHKLVENMPYDSGKHLLDSIVC
jgi:hypothetical protein